MTWFWRRYSKRVKSEKYKGDVNVIQIIISLLRKMRISFKPAYLKKLYYRNNIIKNLIEGKHFEIFQNLVVRYTITHTKQEMIL